MKFIKNLFKKYIDNIILFINLYINKIKLFYSNKNYLDLIPFILLLILCIIIPIFSISLLLAILIATIYDIINKDT